MEAHEIPLDMNMTKGMKKVFQSRGLDKLRKKDGED